MTDPSSIVQTSPPQIDATVLGYLKPILTAAVTRGLLALSAFLAAKGILVPAVSSVQVSEIVLAAIGFGTWAWGPIKAYVDHRVKAELSVSAPQPVKR